MFTCEEKEVETNEEKVRSFSVVLFDMMGMGEMEFVLHLNVVCDLIFRDLHTSHWGLPPYAESVSKV